MFSFAEGNTWLATFGGSLSGLLAGYSLTYLPWTGIESAYSMSNYPQPSSANPDLNQAQGMLFLIGMIPIAVLLLGSVRTALPIAASTLLVLTAFILQGASLLTDAAHGAVQTAAGAFFIMAGILFWYTCLAVLLQEEGIKILPVFPLPRVD